MTKQFPDIGIVGATGIVGREALDILESRGHPPESIRCFGSVRSAGSTLSYMGTALPILPMDQIIDTPLDFALLCASSQVAVQVRALLSGLPTTIIDNSSAFRMEPDVPLVIPEVNGDLLEHQPAVVANPNCSTIMMLTALQPIRNSFGIQSICVTTYQAVSGAGKAGIQELRNQSQSYLDGRDESPSVFPVSCAMNVFEHESEIDPDTGFNGEESKMIQESRRIWQDPSLSILPTCVRVPVERAHSQAITIVVDIPVRIEQIRNVLRVPGIQVMDDGFPLTPRDAAGCNDVFVGRIRIDPLSDGKRVLLWICCDQVRKGAALNAIQIMDSIRKNEQSVFENAFNHACS